MVKGFLIFYLVREASAFVLDQSLYGLHLAENIFYETKEQAEDRIRALSGSDGSRMYIIHEMFIT